MNSIQNNFTLDTMGKVKSAQKSKVKGHITQMKKTSKVTYLRNVQLHFQDDSSSRLDLCPVNAQTDERTDGRTDERTPDTGRQ